MDLTASSLRLAAVRDVDLSSIVATAPYGSWLPKEGLTDFRRAAGPLGTPKAVASDANSVGTFGSSSSPLGVRSRSTSPEGDVKRRRIDDDLATHKSSQMSAEEKRMKRVMANRRSAKESRERRRKHLENLEATMTRLTEEHDELARQNRKLRAKIDVLERTLVAPAAVMPPAVPAASGEAVPPSLQDQLSLLLIQQQQQRQQAIAAASGIIPSALNPATFPSLLRQSDAALPPVAVATPFRPSGSSGNSALSTILAEAQKHMP